MQLPMMLCVYPGIILRMAGHIVLGFYRHIHPAISYTNYINTKYTIGITRVMFANYIGRVSA